MNYYHHCVGRRALSLGYKTPFRGVAKPRAPRLPRKLNEAVGCLNSDPESHVCFSFHIYLRMYRDFVGMEEQSPENLRGPQRQGTHGGALGDRTLFLYI